MNKKAKFTLYGGGFGAIIKMIQNAIKQHNQINENVQLNFDWRQLFWKGLEGAAIGAGGGFVIGAIADLSNSLEKPLNTSILLLGLANTIKLDKSESEYINLSNKADRLTEILEEEFFYQLASKPIRFGSTEKGTALRDNYDIDICLPFKSDSFPSTGQMLDTLSSFLEQHIGNWGILKVNEQKRSVGILVNINGKEMKIDFVPNKITKKKGNKTSGYLHVSNKSIFEHKSTYTKTDVSVLNSIKLTETQRKIIVIIKDWKNQNDVPLSSHLLQHLVLDAYKYNRIPRNFTEKLVMVFRHISDKLDIAVIRSPENTNNIITDISDEKKAQIIDACKKVIEDYEYQPNSILKTFNIE
jgi:hypothetical protein